MARGLAIFVGLVLLASMTQATEIAFIAGSGDWLEKNLREWRLKHPDALITHINMENYEDQVKSKKGTQRVFVTRGMYLYYDIDKNILNKDRQNSVEKVIPVARGVVFVPGYGEALQENLSRWRKSNPDLNIAAAGIELSDRQYQTEDGQQRLIMPRGMWLFYNDNYFLPIEQTSTENYVRPMSKGIVFIEGAGELLQQRLTQWKEQNPQLSIKTTSVEDFTDQIWTSDGYKRMVVARGLWIFFEDLKNPQRDRKKSEVPYAIAEDYLKKALASAGATSESSIVLPLESKSKLLDAQYWYAEVIKDYPQEAIAAAAELRKVYVQLWLAEPQAGDALADIFSRYQETNYELPALYDLVMFYKNRKDLVKQLILYQRIVKICKDDPYSQETYEAVKAIERINREIAILKNSFRG